jgi:hypothetical protein
MRARTILIATITVLLTPTGAHAYPAQIGAGSDPGVAVDAAGTAHVAYNDDYDGSGEALMYCAWPRGARDCTPRPIVNDGEAPSNQPALVNAGPAPGELTIVSARDGLQVVRSLDGGATFGPPAVIGDGRYFDGAFGPGGQLALSFRNLGYIEYYHRSIGAPSTGEVDLNHNHAISSESGFSADGRPVVVSGAQVPWIAVSSWTGQGSVYEPSTWAGPFRIAPSNYFALAGGPRGLFLGHDAPAGSWDRMVVRKFDGQRFRRPRRIPAGRLGHAGIINVALTQDAKGRLMAAWYSSPRNRIEASASRNGRRWTPARVVARRVTLPSRIELALDPKGRGLLVWDSSDEVFGKRVSARKLLRRR